MRASRLLSILLLLQTRGQLTASALADELEVSERTIYRDIDALSAAGVPVYAERGPAGGYQLLGGYRTRLTGMTLEEAETLFLTGLAEPAAKLGLGETLAAAQLKLLASLPPEAGSRAQRISERLYLDAPDWFHQDEQLPHLPLLGAAVWEERRVRMRYQRRTKEVTRLIEPLGIVLKAGAWYVVAAVGGDLRTYRASRILEFEVLDEQFDRPRDFDLGRYWQEWSESYERWLYRDQALVRFTPRALRLIPLLFNPVMVEAVEQHTGQPDADGWVTMTIPIESIKQAPMDLLRLGADAEVLEPPELRQQMARIAHDLTQLYADA